MKRATPPPARICSFSIGALATGTHGFGPRGVMADSIVELSFLDGAGQRQTLAKGDPDFDYVALSFGTIDHDPNRLAR